MNDEQSAYTIKACDMAENAISIIRDNIRSNTHVGRVRALSYLDSTKRWLTQIDRLLPTTVYTRKLCAVLNRCTTDPDKLDIEYHEGKKVLVISGAFDVDKLRDFLTTV